MHTPFRNVSPEGVNLPPRPAPPALTRIKTDFQRATVPRISKGGESFMSDTPPWPFCLIFSPLFQKKNRCHQTEDAGVWLQPLLSENIHSLLLFFPAEINIRLKLLGLATITRHGTGFALRILEWTIPGNGMESLILRQACYFLCFKKTV